MTSWLETFGRRITIRLDHIAYRVANRDETVKFFVEAFGYKFQAEFEIFFNDAKTDKALCIALEPPEKVIPKSDWVHFMAPGHTQGQYPDQAYHMAPEIFVSQGTPGSIVWDWVQARGGVGGIHHLAYQVPSVKDKMAEWKAKGYAEFTSSEPMHCPGLTQVFTKPSKLTGVIFEFIEREGFGFCQANVKQLMESTKEFSGIKAHADAYMH